MESCGKEDAGKYFVPETPAPTTSNYYKFGGTILSGGRVLPPYSR